MKNKLLVMAGIACTVFPALTAMAQSLNARYKDGLRIYMSDDSTKYIKGTGLAQVWLRYNMNNPGSAINGTPRPDGVDIGLRRVRYQVMAQISKKVFFYTQFGINSSNSISSRRPQMYFHDVTAEYNVYRNYVTIGAGLSGWNGLARFSSSNVSTILAMDLPTVEETANDISDQFVRKMGVYAKGKIGGFDYRFSVANPYPVQTATTAPGIASVATLPAAAPATASQPTLRAAYNAAYYSTRAPDMQYQGYVMWQFLDKESNLVPYNNGSYLGRKRVLNVGAGFEYQQHAMVYRASATDTAMRFTASQQFGVDIFYDSYLDKEKQNAITAYVAGLRYDFGPNFIRNAAAMNTATGVAGASSFNGPGNAMPLIGTGTVLYGQAAYLFKKDLLGKQGALQPYASGFYAQYERLSDPVMVYDLGINWLISGQNARISLDYQSALFSIKMRLPAISASRGRLAAGRWCCSTRSCFSRLNKPERAVLIKSNRKRFHISRFFDCRIIC